jgi:hypothetical protein
MQDLLEKMDFGNEAADDADPVELASYFVEQTMFHEFLSPHKKLLIATARKGVGKSALLQWAAHKIAANDEDVLVIRCRGADLVRSKFNLTSPLQNPNDHIRDWMIRICAVINRQLALNIGLALTDDHVTLVETAELEGYKSRNLVGCLLDRLHGVLDKRAPEKLKAKDEIQLLKRVKNRNVWIMIDDLDATYQNTKEESLELSTFFSACRYLLQDMKGVFVRVTMRTDVWALIRRFDESLDKTDQYVSEINWLQKDFLQLLFLRIKAHLDKLRIPLPTVPAHVPERDAQERVLELIFVPKMDWGSSVAMGIKTVDTYKVIYTMSYERPRWAIQLCKLAQAACVRKGQKLITKEILDEVWGEYGAKRIADLVAEHKHQCPELEELLNAFRGCERLLSRADLVKWINNRICSHLGPSIEGPGTRSALDIARFLYRLGFIVARSDSSDGSGSYEHYRFDQMPDFLSARTNDDFGVKWEIHPCYREALDIQKLDKSHREKFFRGRRRPISKRY